MAVFNVVFDGQSVIRAFGGRWNWDNRYLNDFQPWTGSSSNVSHTLNITFEGQDWFAPIIRIEGETGLSTRIRDNSNGNSEVDILRLGRGDVDVRLGATRIEQLIGHWSEQNVTIRTGEASIRNIYLGDGDHDITVPQNSEVDHIYTADGNDLVTIAGEVTFVNTEDGDDNVVIRGEGNIHSLRMDDGNNSLQLNGQSRVRQAEIDGNSRIVLSDEARLSSLQAEGGEVSIILNDDARIFQMKLGEGENTLRSADGNIESFYSHGGRNTLNIGDGGATQIGISGDGGLQKIVSTGWLGSVIVYDDNRTVVTLKGGAAAGSIRLSSGNDRVKTAQEWVSHIRTQDGDDKVIIGAGGATVFLGNGDDTAVVKIASDNSAILFGSGGLDTANLGKLGAAINVSLESWGTWQDVTGNSQYVQFTNIEAVIGSRFDDTMAGDDEDNWLTGAKGNDTLTGMEGGDTFVILSRSGTDTVTDFSFTDGDRIVFRGADEVGDLDIREVGDDVRVAFNRSAVIVENVSLTDMQDPAIYDL